MQLKLGFCHLSAPAVMDLADGIQGCAPPPHLLRGREGAAVHHYHRVCIQTLIFVLGNTHGLAMGTNLELELFHGNSS